jgi:ribonuclease D
MIDIQTDRQLAEYCSSIAETPRLALDTEFIREKTYFPVLALVQIAAEGGEPVLVDPLGLDLAPLITLLDKPTIQKVLHAGRQDVEIFQLRTGRVPSNIFDTQVAAALLGWGEQIGYANLVASACKVELAKGARFTDWLSRPLHESQLDYARNDVRYLLQAQNALLEQGQRLGRLERIQEAMTRSYDPVLFTERPDRLWQKVKRWNTLSPKDYVVLQALARWRDEEARRIDRPIRMVLSDEALIELARTTKLDQAALQSKRFASTGFLKRFAEALLVIHRQARETPRSEWPKLVRIPTVAPQAERVAGLAWLLVESIAEQQSMAPASLIAKRDLPALVDLILKGEELNTTLDEWQAGLLAKPLQDLVLGRTALAVRKGDLAWIPTAANESGGNIPTGTAPTANSLATHGGKTLDRDHQGKQDNTRR